MRSPENQQYLSMLEQVHMRINDIGWNHTNVLLILMRPHSSILMCYWLSWYPFRHTDWFIDCWLLNVTSVIFQLYCAEWQNENDCYVGGYYFLYTWWCSRFVSFRSISFRFISFRFVSFRFRFAFYRYPKLSYHTTGCFRRSRIR
jgi:hypothetical protein